MRFLTIKKKNLFKGLIILSALVLGLVGVGLTGYAKVYANKSSRKLPIYCVETEEQVVSISFDASWGADKTLGILKVLEEQDIKANYFVIGQWAEKYSTELKTLADSGRVEIGTHSQTHPDMAKKSAREISLELSTSNAIIEDITGQKIDLFRPPFGSYSDTLLTEAEKLGLYTIQWDVDSLDWKDKPASEMTTRILSKVNNGSIILMHNDGKNTLEALPAIILGLKNKGYTFKTIGELIYRDNYTIDHTGKQIRR